MPLMVSLAGRSELKTLAQAETAGSYRLLQGENLFSGLYLNELLIRLATPADPQPLLFAAYQNSIERLATATSVEPVLRQFEWLLLDVLGYGFSLECDASGRDIEPEARYAWQAEQGLIRLEGIAAANGQGLPGQALLSMAAGIWDEPVTLRAAKQLMRQALAAHLGDRPLMSRQLFSRQPTSIPEVKDSD